MYRNLTRLTFVFYSSVVNALTRKLDHHSSGVHFPLLNQIRFAFSLPHRHILKPVSIRTMADHVDKSDLRNRLTPVQFHVTQEKGTERPFSGCYNKTYDSGTYLCVVCEQPLFSSETKYDSGCGWPAFNDVLEQGKVKLSPDTSGGRIRTEVTCSKCGAHLGHVFNDGPAPTKKRFCINSASLNFVPDKKEDS